MVLPVLIVPPRKMSFASLTSLSSLLSAGERLLCASASKSVIFSRLAFFARCCLVTALWIWILVRSSYLLAICPWGKSQSSKLCGMYPNELCLVSLNGSPAVLKAKWPTYLSAFGNFVKIGAFLINPSIPSYHSGPNSGWSRNPSPGTRSSVHIPSMQSAEKAEKARSSRTDLPWPLYSPIRDSKKDALSASMGQ